MHRGRCDLDFELGGYVDQRAVGCLCQSECGDEESLLISSKA